MIEVRGLVKNHGPLRVLDGVSLSVRRGEVATIVGPSGGGKSTLLRCINGLEPFEEGEVQVDQIRLRPNAAPRELGAVLRDGVRGSLKQLGISMTIVEKDVGYEFLDNSVREGERPRTIASFHSGSTGASSEAMKRVPMLTPAAPSMRAAAIPRPS